MHLHLDWWNTASWQDCKTNISDQHHIISCNPELSFGRLYNSS